MQFLHTKLSVLNAGVPVEIVQHHVGLDALPETGPIAVVHVDVDEQIATHQALLEVAPRVVRRGVIVLSDPGGIPHLAGSLAAMEMFLRTDAGRAFVGAGRSASQFLDSRAHCGSIRHSLTQTQQVGRLIATAQSHESRAFRTFKRFGRARSSHTLSQFGSNCFPR